MREVLSRAVAYKEIVSVVAMVLKRILSIISRMEISGLSLTDLLEVCIHASPKP